MTREELGGAEGHTQGVDREACLAIQALMNKRPSSELVFIVHSVAFWGYCESSFDCPLILKLEIKGRLYSKAGLMQLLFLTL